MDHEPTPTPAEQAAALGSDQVALRSAEQAAEAIADAVAGSSAALSAGDWRSRCEQWPTAFTVKALFGNARFVGEVRIERNRDTVTVVGKRVDYWLYWVRFWLIALFIALIIMPPVQEFGGVAAIVNLAAVLLLVTVGGRLLLVGMAKMDMVTFSLGSVARPSVGLRIRGWHLLLVGFSGLAALIVFALYRGGRRTVSVDGDRGDGHLVRYLFMARDEAQAIQLAAMLLP